MRRVPLPPEPPSLSGPKAKQERDDVAEFYADPAHANLPYPGTFQAYKAADVKKALHEAFHGKCAYCESPIEDTQPDDIEHFRPKGAVKIGGKLQPPGYHWLASRWGNLLPSCIFCNRLNRQEFPAGMVATAGKGNQFPLMSEVSRAKADGEESCERPLLLNPFFDDPAQHFEFIWDPQTLECGQVVPRRRGDRKSRIGDTSIRVYALQRVGLVRRRCEHLVLLIAHLEGLVEIRQDILECRDNPKLVKRFEERFAKQLTQLANFIDEDKTYSAMCKQVVLAYHPRLMA